MKDTVFRMSKTYFIFRLTSGFEIHGKCTNLRRSFDCRFEMSFRRCRKSSRRRLFSINISLIDPFSIGFIAHWAWSTHVSQTNAQQQITLHANASITLYSMEFCKLCLMCMYIHKQNICFHVFLSIFNLN